MARRANKKRKHETLGEGIVKKARSSRPSKGPSSCTGGSSLDSAKNASAAEAPSSTPLLGLAEGDKKLENPTLTTMKITLPIDFLSGDRVERSEVFPSLEHFSVPCQWEKLKGKKIEELDADVLGHSFLAFQSSLALHAKMEAIKKLAAESQAREDAALTKFQRAVDQGKEIEARINQKEVEMNDLRGRLDYAEGTRAEQATRLKLVDDRVMAQDRRIEDLQKEKEDCERMISSLRDEGALIRLTARAAIMR